MSGPKGRKPGPKSKKKEEKPEEISQSGIEPPVFLSNKARNFWFQYRDLLIKAKMLTDADVGVFAAFCDQMALVEECEKEIEKHGVLIDDARGSKKANPAIGIKNRAWSQVLAFARQLGLTPKARNVQGRNIPPPQGGGALNDGSPVGTGSEIPSENRRARLFKVVN